jgi:hypothetical protein
VVVAISEADKCKYPQTIVKHPRLICFFRQENFLVPNVTKMTKCVEWEYNTTDNLGNTWINEWDLVCDKKYLKLVAEMIFLIGVATGGIISGMLSDKFGRKKMLFISAVFQAFFGEFQLKNLVVEFLQ